MKKRFVFLMVLTLVIIMPMAMVSHGVQQLATNQFPPSLTSPLTKHDSEYYAAAFVAQRKLDWQAADNALDAVSNQILLGHVLAERYLHRKYTPTKDELSAWLANYRDHPQAYDMYRLAADTYGMNVPAVAKPEMVRMMGDDNGLAKSFGESKFADTWKQGISAYSAGHYLEAATAFEAMIEGRKDLSPWKVSAAGFWAWRAYSKLGNDAQATKALRIAASEPRSFYGILARKHIGEKLDMQEEGLTLSADDITLFRHKISVARAAALAQSGRNDLAERELRIEYTNLARDERPAMLRLAHNLRLPALQIALAKRMESKTARLDLAKYPIPEWQPVGGFSVDPALIYALVRQESGFRATAISPAGASGLMQLMPATARMMDTKIGNGLEGASDAERNITLGQGYVRHLLDTDLVDNNVIFMLTSYNAGIGRLQEWKKSIHYQNDPLLFIEQIPYGETRHYVMQVMTNYWLYSEILGSPAPTLASLAMNEWPVYRG